MKFDGLMKVYRSYTHTSCTALTHSSLTDHTLE
jgi:hypothetical protein